ncbi:hypothetical protein BJ875DRAFT_281306 [Amylocarpus encephaloides]|uniref:SH3 domain-containing protein n=1 Tax=Amylocarpus encephaloides TaxID=45428 RepID=A0A9P7YL25_9HELO|nr:hypothetical protein BJ875DRAFT_281306 [Amylocarpus encephaloides]
MASHHHLHQLHARVAVADPAPVPATLVSVVYVTATPTFDGPIGGYTTVGVAAESEDATPVTSASSPAKTTSPAAIAPVATPKSSSAAVVEQSSSSAAVAKSSKSSSGIDTDTVSSSATRQSSSSSLPTAITAPSTTLATSLAVLAATSSLSISTPSLSQTASAATSTSSVEASSDEGIGAGAKAGIAIGVLMLVGAILTIVLYCFKKRKNAQRQAVADREKHEDPFADHQRAASIRTNNTSATSATAPRLSLRPVTQFLPNLSEKRQSQGNVLMTGHAVPMSEKPLPMSRPDTAQSNNAANPFGNHAETIDSANANGPTVMTSPVMASPIVDPSNAPYSPPIVGGVIAGTAPVLKRAASKRENGPKALDFTKAGPFMGPPSPAGTEFSETAESTSTPTKTPTSVAIAAAGGPANSVVHRVQLDFKPSMDDELELRAGQLIRVLHEYDDGWALCIRLDRSQQGVVPRTCLSTRPVKPRPQQNGLRGPPQGRPMSPAMQQGRPMSPSGRPMTPNGQPGRPMTPNGQNGSPNRPMNPNQQGRPRAPSNAPSQGRRNSPPGPSRMNPAGPMDQGAPQSYGGPPARKPVPGQAL